MTSAPEPIERSNPFATRFIRPGAIEFLYPAGESGQSVVERLRGSGWRGQIVGPHGSGKSTLLVALSPALAAAGRRCWHVALRDAQRSMPAGWLSEAAQAQANLIVIDGYEQLPVWNRWRVQLACRRRSWGLLITTHRDLGLPLLFSTSVDLNLAERVVGKLLASEGANLPAESIAAQFHATGGNLRETLFRLYDVWEQATRESVGGSGPND